MNISNFDLIEKNDLSTTAMGGIELFMRYLYSGKIPRELLQQVQIIPGRVRELKQDKIRILTLHDMAQDPECEKLKDPAFRAQFHKLVFVSNWQYQQFRDLLGVPYDLNSTVIEHAIRPVKVDIAKKFKYTDRVVNICYHTTPHRGLELLVPVFMHLAKKDLDIHLHVHSSFQIYGRPGRDTVYEPVFEDCRRHPQITYYGFTEYDELMKRLPFYHIFGYPCIWQETACRAVIEAMSAGMVCVHPDFGALPDTTGCLNIQYNGTSNVNEMAQTFMKVLQGVIAVVRNSDNRLIEQQKFNKEYVDTRYSPGKQDHIWTQLLSAMVTEFPTPESRRLPL